MNQDNVYLIVSVLSNHPCKRVWLIKHSFLLPDGYTETIHDTIDNLQHLVQTVGEYLN
ncbi:hypothetical protein VPHF94_0105 [Vibrio phage F94]